MSTSENLNAKTTGSSLTAAQYNRMLMSGSPSYHVHRASSTYYARKTRGNEVILYSDTNYADLMNYIIDDLWDGCTGVGGAIYHRSGEYIADDTIDMRSGIHVWGESRCGSDSRTTLCTIIKATTDKPIFEFDYPANAGCSYHSGLHRMWLDGNGAVTTTPIVNLECNTNNLGDVFLNDLSIVNGYYGIQIYNNNASYRIWNVFIDRCFIEENTYAGLYVNGIVDKRIFQCRFTRNHFYGNNTTGGNGAMEIAGIRTRGGVIEANTFELENRHAIYLGTDTHHWVINCNVLVDTGEAAAGTYDGVHLAASDYNSITGNVIGNILTSTIAAYGGDSTENTRYGVNIVAGSTYNAVTGNTCGEVATDGVLDNGANNEVANNVENPDP